MISRFESMAVIFSIILGSVQQALMALGLLKISSIRRLNSAFTWCAAKHRHRGYSLYSMYSSWIFQHYERFANAWRS